MKENIQPDIKDEKKLNPDELKNTKGGGFIYNTDTFCSITGTSCTSNGG